MSINSINFTLGSSVSISAINKLTLVGCNALGMMATSETYAKLCVSVCNSQPAANGTCSGEGCCTEDISGQTAPWDGSSVEIGSFRVPGLNLTDVRQFNPCVYTFLVEGGKFHFNSSEDLMNLRNVTRFPVVLDWSVGNHTCEQMGNTSILCGKNSACSKPTARTGYICTCNEGFDGNPYTSEGCLDINECATGRHNCKDDKACKNKFGSYECKCQSGNRFDTISMSCKSIDYRWAKILIGTITGFLFILLGVSCIHEKMKHRKDTLREKFFEQNGGLMLIQRLSGAGPSNLGAKVFTEEEMKEATNDYNESRILGQGGQGTVYKGILPDSSVVAIKKARLVDRNQVGDFINEVVVLSQINHRNVVKLLGFCLETETPLLVYEFVTNGTLSDHLHGSLSDSSLTWEQRLRIAIEIAGSLAYLHSSASIPIIHRDVKTANILLDENLTAKVADFGASRLIPMEKDQLITMVQGTVGYLDPEYHNTGLLNEKSDVYSFGVVLMELLSGQKALCFERPHKSKHLGSYFASAMKENRLHEVIDKKVINENSWKEIEEAARVAMECTRVTGEERPLMTEVAAKLEGLRVTKSKHQWSDQYPGEETENLVGVDVLSAQGDTSSTGYDSIKNVARLHIEAGR
ncbi:hypothetical protein N665_0541s0001 [Sinapis alba]|nr:hypothetical protein N665_0541s0001 [Sinapis alba]